MTKGIGRELVKKLAALDANIIAVSQTQSKLDSLKDELKDKSSITTVRVDLGSWKETESKLSELCKNVDFLVNNAGFSHSYAVDEITEEGLDRIYSINLKAPINLIRMVARGMKERKFGSIVNVASVAGIAALDDHLAYGSSKAALDMVTKISAKELGPYNIRVNSINPTVILTDMSIQHWSEPTRRATMISKIPMGRFVEIHEAVEPIIFLLGDGASMINGVQLPIDGGFVAC